MKLHEVRNIGIAAHIDAGKTTLTERVLFFTGASHKVGEVHEGDAHMDFMPEERAHGITITTAVTQCPWKNHLIQVVDTPGHVDFTIEVERAMRVLDGAVIVMDGVRGVEPQTETVWRQASRFEIPRLVFVNKMDRPGACFARAMESLERRLDGSPVPVCVPTEDNRVIDLVHGKVYSFGGDRGEEVSTTDVPPDLMDLFNAHRETLLLAAAEEDPALEEAVLEDEYVEPAAIISAIRKATLAGRAHPVFGGSALRNWGVQPLLNGVLALLPSPLDRPPAIGTSLDGEEEQLIEMNAKEPFVGLVFKVQLMGGRRHAFLRIYRGTLCPGDSVMIAGKEQTERVARVFDVDAGSTKRLKEAKAGQIVVLAGVRWAGTGDTLCDPSHPVLLERIEAKEPVLGLAIETNSTKDEEKLVGVLHKICEEDPTLSLQEDEETGQRILKGMGELHLMIVFERIEREFGVQVRAGRPHVVTRETMGGSGQADVEMDRLLQVGDEQIRLHASVSAQTSPLGRNDGMTLDCAPSIQPSGAALSNAQVEALENGARDGMNAGPKEGAPLQDVAVKITKVELYGNDSSPQALRIAASQAVREALANAGGLVLSPIMQVEVVVPDENMGSVLGDLQTRRATISGQESEMGLSTILGNCPLQNLLGYTTELRSLTRGRGQFTMEFSRFDVG